MVFSMFWHSSWSLQLSQVSLSWNIKMKFIDLSSRSGSPFMISYPMINLDSTHVFNFWNDRQRQYERLFPSSDTRITVWFWFCVFECWLSFSNANLFFGGKLSIARCSFAYDLQLLIALLLFFLANPWFTNEGFSRLFATSVLVSGVIPYLSLREICGNISL